MKISEKILIGLTVIAAIYFIADNYLITDENKDKNKLSHQTNEGQKSSTDMFAQEQLSILKTFKQSDADEMTLKKAVKNWNNDPFASPELMQQIKGKPETSETTAKTSTRKQVPISYSGYIHAGRKLLAIINGMEYEQGDTIQGTNFKILTASTTSIMLRSPDATIAKIDLIDNLNPFAGHEE